PLVRWASNTGTRRTIRETSVTWTPLAEVTSSGACKMRVINGLALSTFLLAIAGGTSLAQDKPADATLSVAVGAQYDTAHVYVAPADLDRFSDSLVATFGGTKSQQAVLTI